MTAVDESFDRRRRVVICESGLGQYGQVAVARRHVVTADEPVGLDGMDTGADPIELLMTSLGACTAMTMRMYASRRRAEVGKITVVVEHEMAARSGRNAELFLKTVYFEPGIDASLAERLLQIAERCPVHQILAGRPIIESRLGGEG